MKTDYFDQAAQQFAYLMVEKIQLYLCIQIEKQKGL